MPSSGPTRKIGTNELQVLQRFAEQFVHEWDDLRNAPRALRFLAQSKVVTALKLLRDVCKALGLLDSELRLQGQRSNLDLLHLLFDLREVVGAMQAKVRFREVIGVDVNKCKDFDLRSKPPTDAELKKGLRTAPMKLGCRYLDPSSVAFKRQWIDIVRKAAERLPKAPPVSMATPAKIQDGPTPPNQFRWNDELYLMQPLVWALANALWNRESRPRKDVIEECWAYEDNASESAIKTALSRLKSRFQEIGVPWHYRLKGQFFYRTP